MYFSKNENQQGVQTGDKQKEKTEEMFLTPQWSNS